MRRHSWTLILALAASGPVPARAYNPPQESAAQAQARTEFYQQGLAKAKGGGPDQVISERLAEPLGGSLPSIPKPSRFEALHELIDMVAEIAEGPLGDGIKNAVLKNMPKEGMVEHTMGNIDKLLDQMDPRSARKAEAALALAKSKMAADYAQPNMQYCQGIPPIVCNPLDGGRYECAGGPQRYLANGIPPWEYTLVAKCAGTRFLGFDSFSNKGAGITIAPTTDDGHGGRNYRGVAHAAYCVPCPNQPPSSAGTLLRCLFVGCR